MPKVTIVGVGGFVTHGDIDQARPVGRGAVIDVDQATADRLVVDGVARAGEHKVDPILAPGPATVENDAADSGTSFDAAAASDDGLLAWINGDIGHKPTGDEVVVAAQGNELLAERLLDAEQATENRKTVVSRLEKIRDGQ